jgi:AraC family transcriptional regulator, regulatory protein of adaptative response / methylated-DNA-[protein]-cysteine methyltransferase
MNEILSDDQRWAVCQARDASYDGRFFTAVRSTRIYCRPSCAARPLRKNVSFYDSAEAAEAAGFRPCKRCQPRAERAPAAQLIERVTDFVRTQGHARLDALASELGYSPFYLQRVFKAQLGVSPAQFARSWRVDQVKTALSAESSVTTALLDAGQPSPVKTHLGMTPSAYRSGGSGEAIGYLCDACSLGRLLIAATPVGICALYFGDSDAELLRALREEFPGADIGAQPNNQVLRGWADTVLAVLSSERTHETLTQLPLDLRGTAFQALVWQALRAIPAGETRSYADVAASIGRPNATRAVANACGANRVALVIPCHRVVRGTGGTGGYRWGSGRKARLLSDERTGEASATNKAL